MSTPLQLTPAAAQQILQLTQHNPACGLRLYIDRGGCSGFQYNMDIATAQPDDIILEQHGARLYLDPRSQAYLQGSIIDYEDALSGAGFRIKNPNATLTCGCGTSFSTK
jgi:iron-sulfur cluster assembly accessory protein